VTLAQEDTVALIRSSTSSDTACCWLLRRSNRPVTQEHISYC